MKEEDKVKNKPAFVLDCSITMSWCFEDEFDEYVKKILRSLKDHSALVPNLWVLEVSNVLTLAERKNRLTAADSIRFINLIENLPIYFSDMRFSMNELISTAKSNNLTSYKANYLLLAMHEGIELATRDKALIEAAHQNGVLIFGK